MKDIGRCFDEVSLKRPASWSGFIDSLAKRKPPILIKKSGGWALSMQGRQKMAGVAPKRAATVIVDKLLAELPGRVNMLAERVYLEEALKCFRVGAFRAAVVMAWNLAFDHLCEMILRTKLADFNAQLPKSFPKAEVQVVLVRDDLMILKESQVILVCKSAGIVSSNVYKILKEKLDRRNIAAHPSGVEISQLTAEDFIRDLVVNVVEKL